MLIPADTSEIILLVSVKFEEDEPEATIQLILFAVCSTVEMSCSAFVTRVVMLFTFCVMVETLPATSEIRVSKLLTVCVS